MIDSPRPVAWPGSSDELSQTLRIGLDSSLLCHGITLKKQGCKRKISQANVAKIETLLNHITRKSSFGSAREQLKDVAILLMCPQDHRSQATLLFERWEKAMLATSARLASDSHPANVKKESVACGSQPVRSAEAASPKVENGGTRVKTEHEEAATPSINRTPRTPTRAPRQNSKPPSSPSQAHSFERFSGAKTTYQINVTIRERLLEQLRGPERPGPNEGFIYIYTFPEDYRLRAPPLKIGFASDVSRRMGDWRRQCGYTPKLLSTTGAELYKRVEKLVHAHLQNQRKREVGCPGCGKSHKEWFQVTGSEAARIVGLWTAWSRMEPYDEQGELRNVWRRRLRNVDLKDASCWDGFVNGDDDDDDDDDDGDDGDDSDDSDDSGDSDDD